MSFWSNFIIKAPAVLSGVSGVTGLAATLLPQYAAPLTTITALIGIFGASLHSLNPAVLSEAIVPNKVEVTVEQIAAISNILNQDK